MPPQWTGEAKLVTKIRQGLYLQAGYDTLARAEER